MAGQLLPEGSAAEAPGGPTLQPRLSRSTDKGIPALGAGPERSPQGSGANPACEEQGLVQLEACSPATLRGSQQAAPCSGPRLGARDTMWVRPRNLRLHGAGFEDQQSGELERGRGAAAGARARVSGLGGPSCDEFQSFGVQRRTGGGPGPAGEVAEGGWWGREARAGPPLGSRPGLPGLAPRGKARAGQERRPTPRSQQAAVLSNG